MNHSKLLIIALLLTSTLFAGDVIKLANGDWPPYSGKMLPQYGTISQVLAETFKAGDLTVEYGFFAWNLAYTLATTTDEWNGSTVWAKSEEREKECYFSDKPVLVASNVFFHRKDKEVKFEKLEDLSSMKIGATAEYYYGEEFERLEKEGVLNVVRVPSDMVNLQMLLGKKIDLFICVTEVGYHLLANNFPKEDQALITNNSKVVEEAGYYLILSKKQPKNEQIIKNFDINIQKLRDSGRYDEIMGK